MAGALTERGGPPGPGRAVGSSGPKGEAIAAAALRLFLRDGYERTSVDAIAAAAEVSKRTIYNRYGDKESLFLSVLRDTFATSMATFAGIAEAYLGGDGDAQQALTAFARETALTLTTAPERIAMVRLIMTEAPYFPALMRAEMSTQSMHATISRYLARMAADGRLDITDPAEAADHLFALTFGQINSRTMFGAIQLSSAELDQVITSGVGVFVRAYRPS
jgi:TetR/AcrR family transcriptional regulator, mexJK operon transcriptional repressor